VTVDKDLFQNYLDILSSWGVKCKDSRGREHFEFAKRDFFQGMEITGLGSKALCAEIYNPIGFIFELMKTRERAYPAFDYSHPSILNLLKANKKDKRRIKIFIDVPLLREGPNFLLDVARWTVTNVGNSGCRLPFVENAIENALKPFYQAGALVLHNQFSEIIDGSRKRFQKFSHDWELLAFKKLHESQGNRPSKDSKTQLTPCKHVMWSDSLSLHHRLILSEILDDQKLLIRVLEKEWKELILSKNVISYFKPKIPEIFYTDLVKYQSKYRIVRKWRIKQISRIRNLLTTH
jgi:hypothetical protein